MQQIFDPADFELESRRPQGEYNMVGGDFRTLLNTNASENSETTAETNRAINAKISSQMSTKVEELKADLNSPIVEVIGSALEEKVIPAIKMK